MSASFTMLYQVCYNRSPQNCSGTAINPSHKWPNIRVQLIWVSGHEGIVGNETTDRLARTGSGPACGIPIGVAKRAVRDSTKRNHERHWQSITGLRQAKGLIQWSSARRTKDVLKLNRDQGHLSKLGMTDDPSCERCLENDESATLILCDC
jgi:hypothetical protein